MVKRGDELPSFHFLCIVFYCVSAPVCNLLKIDLLYLLSLIFLIKNYEVLIFSFAEGLLSEHLNGSSMPVLTNERPIGDVVALTTSELFLSFLDDITSLTDCPEPS